MSMSLYQATVPTYLQIIGAVSGLLDKAEAHCSGGNLPDEDLTLQCLAEDMKPFAYQITSVSHHSIGAIRGVEKGVFSPDTTTPPSDFASLRKCLVDTVSALEALKEDDVNALSGKPARFEFGSFKIDFVAENFLLSFSQPNFYFHAVTAYDILRMRGLSIGKMDFLGQLRSA